MEIKQVYSFLNNIVRQTTGISDVDVEDARGLVDLGERVLSSNTNLENFFNTIYDVTAKTIISNRPYTARVKALMMDTFTFGAILRKIYVDPMKARENVSWDIDDNSGAGKEYTPIFVVKPSVKTKIFSGLNSWEFDTAIPDVQIRSAFHNEQEMVALIDAIYTSLENSISLALEAMAQTTYGTMIADRLINYTNPDSLVGHPTTRTVVDLREEYNAFYGLEDGDAGYIETAAQFNSTPECYRFAGKVIKETIDHMEQMSVTFNTQGYHRHTPKSKLRVTMIEDWVSAFDTYLQSDVFHNELTKLPNYVSVPYWQGSGDDWSTDNTRKVALKVQTSYAKDSDGEPKEYEVEQDGIVCMLSDMEAMGMTINNERRKSVYDPRHEVTCVYAKADKGYYIDPSENCVIFVVTDEIATPTDLNPPSPPGS